jgi:undecaprenyl-diphosphatase
MIYGFSCIGLFEICKAILFGIIEGITEWLPVSSTGHMILLQEFVKLDVSPEFWEMFLVVIQFGAILAVVILFWNRLWPFATKKNHWIKKDVFSMWFKVIVACIPAGIIGLLFDEKLEELFYNYQTVSIALIVFGIIFIIVETLHKGKESKVHSIAELSYLTAVLIGMFQVLAAVFPGTSRSGVTIIGALILGVTRTVAAEFTFFMAVPVMAGASLLKIIDFGFDISGMEAMILSIGMIVAFIVSVVVIKFLMGYIKKHDFKIFGWYRIGLGIIVLLYFWVVK